MDLSNKFATRLKAAEDALAGGRHEQAVTELTAAIFLKPSEARPYLLRGEALAELCDFHSAIINHRKALQLTPQTAAERRDRTERLAELLDLRALSLMDDGAFDSSIELLGEALALAPKTSSLPLHRALAHTGREEYETALRDLEACVAGGNASADVHFLRAKLSLLGRDLAAAREAADAALALEPGHAQATELREAMTACAAVYTEESTKLVLLGSPAAAVTNLTHAMALSPDDASLRMRRGAAQRSLGELDAAVVDLEIAVEQAGGSYPAASRLLVLTYNDLGVQHATRGRHAQALEWFDRAVDGGAAEVAPLVNRADCQRACDCTPEALRDYQAALELCPHEPRERWRIQTRLAVVHNERGARLFNHSNPRHAAVEFSRAIECNPKVAHFYVNRAEATLQLNRFELARDDVLLALRLDPTDARAQKMLLQLCPE